MADLRNSFDVNVTNGQLPQIQEEATANGMGALRRGWNAGQLGSEANYLAAQELGLRNEGRHAEADGLRAKIAELQQRQQLYAPQVGRVEDIGGVGDAASWAATQMGQGAASMADPMALAAGVGAAGRVAGMVKNPVTQMFSKAAPYLAGVGAYGVNQRQLTGEMGNSMAADPEVMARTTPQQRWETANEFGAGAALIDTIVPGHLAGKVAGKGALRAFGKTGVLGELGMEGATEAVQEHTSQQVLGGLNPNRDASGDASDLLNAFAGGAVGAGGPVAVGAGAERLHGMAHKTVDAVGEKAGDMVDLANGAATAAKEKGKGFLGGAKDLFGKAEATDLGGAEKAPSKGPAEAPDGAPAGFRLTPDELDTLDPNAGGADPTGPEFMDHVMRRADFVKQKLGSLAESHPEAAQLYAQLTNPSSPEAEFDAADRGAILLHQMHDQDALDAKGKAMEQNLKALGAMAGRGVAAVAKGVAKGAATVGKAAWEGATSKKNEQAQDPHAADLAEKFAANVAAKKNDDRSGVVALARHMVRQLTSAGANAGSTNRNALLNRVASVVQKTYREDAQTVLDEVGKIMGSKGAQAINYVKREVEALSGPQGRLHERQQRHALADQLISLVPHEKEAALASQGINIRMGADRDKLLSLMEDYVDGASDPGLRRRLNAVFGHDTVNKMVAHLNGVAEQKTVEKPAGSGRVEKIKDSDDIVAKDDDGDGDTFGAQKKFDAGQGDRVYGFHQSSTLRARGSGGNDIFAGTTNSQDGKVTRPKLLKADTMVTGPGGKGKVNAITKKIADIRKQLGDRSAEYAVKSRPVSEVMDDHGVQPAAKMAAFRDYLRQDARDDKSLSDDQRKALLKQAMGAARYVLDSMRKPEDGPVRRLKPGERKELRAAAAKYFSERHVVEAAKMVDGMPDRMELPVLMRMAAATRKAVDFARKPGVDANKVMDENNILTFSRDKKALNIRADDLMKWGRNQRLNQESTDLEDNKADFSNAARDKQYLTDLMSGIAAVMDSGLVDKVMPYKTNAQGMQESFKDGIPPSLRLSTTTQKGREFADSKRKTEADVGTAPVQDEDAVAKEQTKERVDGGEADAPMKDDRLSDTNIVKRQAFTAAERDAIAKLPTLKERMAYIAKLRGGEAAENQGEFDKDVALNGTQGAQYNADAREADAKTDRFDKTPLDFFTKQKAGEEKDDFADQRYQSRVEGFDAANIAGPKSAMRARSEINKDAKDIVKALTPTPEGAKVEQKGALGRPAEGFAMIESRLRSAARTAKPDASGLTGGIHFIYPVLKVLNGDAIGTYDFNVAEMKKAVALRAQTAQVLLDADITPKQRVALARELMTSVAADRINVSNVKTALTKVAQAAAPATEPTAAPTADRSAALDKMIADEDYSKLTSKDRVDRFLRAAKDRLPTLRGLLKDDLMSPTQEKAYDALVRMFSPDSDLASFYDGVPGADGITDDQVRAMLDAAPEVAAQAPKSQSAPAGARKLNAMSSMSLDDKLTSVLAERGIVVTRDALEGMPTEDRISLVSRTLRADPSQTMAPDVARFVSWMVVGSDFYSRVDAGIAGTQMEKDIMAKVDRDPRQSLYIPTRKRREVVRQAVEQLLTYGLYKRYAQEGTLSQKLVAVVKEAARYAIEALGGVSFRSLQAEADRLVDGILSGETKLERPRKEGSVLMDPHKAFAEDQHAANIVYGLTEGGGFALTGSLAYAAQGTVYRPAGVPIHDLDLTTNLSQKSAEARLTRLYPQAELVRSFGGLGSFVTTYVVPPKGYTVSDVVSENGAIKGYTVREGGKVVGRYEHTDKGETQSGVRATVVDLIGDTRTNHASMVIPTAFGDKRVPVAHYRDAMTEKLVYARDKDITDFVNFVPHDRKLNQQNAGPNRVASQAEMDAARAYLKKIAPDVKLAFKDITGYSGEFIEAENAIEISTTSPAGVMEVAYHEALHKFFSQFVKSDPKVFAALSALAENQRLIERVHALLKGYPAAQRQLADGEERLAYIFQFWAAGKLDLPVGRPTTIMQKIRKFFRRVAGMISKEERAADLLHAFHNGELSEPSAAGRVIADIMNQGTFTPKQLRRMDKLVQGAAGLVVPSETILAKSESAAARALAKEFYTNPGDETSAGHGEGLLNATRTTAAKNVNRFAGAIRGLSDRDLTDVTRYMQQGTEVSDIPYAPHREAVKAIRQHLSEFYDYMTDRGMKMGKINEKYFPVSWSLNKLTLEADKFKKMLTDNYADKLDEAVNASKVPLTRDDVAGRIWQALIDRNGTDGKIDVTRDDGVLAPFFANSEHRELNWIKPEHSEPFLHKNLVSIMTGYIHQGVKAAEYTERFGRDGKHLDAKLNEIHNELKEIALAKLNAQEFDGKQQADDWVEGQMKNIKRATGAMEGSLGKDISPALRKFNSWMMVYQNLRLLPLTLFASFVDPLGMVARGATMKEAYETFLRGMREVFTNWADMVRDTPKERQSDKWEVLAEHIGALDAIMLSHHVSEEYSSTYLSGGAKKINDALFKLNGMEAWNRGVRAGAVRSAVKFIARHSKLPEVHSKRWLTELSLTDDHIALDNDGELILDADELAKAKGISVPEAKRRVEALHSAINRWVVGAVLTPNSAQRPAWASDPHYSVFFHLKQFSYSFHQTILKRAVQEMNHGNLGPIGAFAGYIPAMIASDVVKGLIVGGGQLPDYMKSYNLGDWVKHGVERSGTLGIAGIGVDASHDIFSLAGPGVEQVMDAMVDPIGQTTLNALPVHGLYAGLLK